jgi:threonine dehydrogenase-like Zn-dependent dehydrogenase
LRLPVIMGHEFSGEVVEVGPKVIDLKVGDLVAVEQIHWCGKCRGCRIGKPNQCSYVEELGLSKNGGFAEYAVIEERFCCNINKLYEKLGDKLAAMEAGALVEPTCVAYSGMIINGGGFRPGANIAVFGAGPIGLAAISIAKVSGAAAIFAFDTMPARLVLAKEVGADYTMNPLELKKQGSSPCEQLLELTEGLGIGMFVEATGNTSAVYSDILHCMDISAKIIQLGVGAKNPEIDLTQLIIRNSSIQGSMGHAGNDIYPSVIRLMAAGKIDMRQIATARYSIEKTSDAINAAAYGTQGKVLVGQYYK